MPGVFSSTMYQTRKLTTMATVVAATRSRKLNIVCPDVWPMLNATMIIAHTSRCLMKKACVCSRYATMPIVMEAQTTRKPKTDSEEPKKVEIFLRYSPNFCQLLVGARCSGFILFFHPLPIYTTLVPASRMSEDSSTAVSSLLKMVSIHFFKRRSLGKMKRFLENVPSSTFSSAKATKSWTASPVACI